MLAVILPFTYDPITQFVMAVPIIFLFYFSVLLVWIANRRVVYETAGVVKAPSEALVAPVTSPPTMVRRRRKLASGNSWQATSGGLKSAAVLKTAVDVVKPGTISRQPLRLDPLNPLPSKRYNLLDLSNQS